MVLENIFKEGKIDDGHRIILLYYRKIFGVLDQGLCENILILRMFPGET
ncbi:hypothetical protein [Sodalis endosymbiont of Henestaris halophilus]|nr:hypothetical protein [Sodalis endosymbiont of Henestaris halophilus]SNC58652.1 hypothetical protein HBA_0397 [Sodalis endosymbiont of Henestaris halophilus]